MPVLKAHGPPAARGIGQVARGTCDGRLSDMTSHRRVDTAGLVIALLLLALSATVFWDMNRLELSAVYGIGPKAMPIVVGTGLALLGIGNGVLAFRGDLPARESADPAAIGLILAGLAALIVLIAVGGGFIL